MLILDLRWLLTALWLLLLLGWGLIMWWLGGHRRRNVTVEGTPETWLTGLLDQAPIGILFLRDRIIHYVNPVARTMLRLEQTEGVLLPDTDWAELLHQDLNAAHDSPTPDPSGVSRYRHITFPSGRTLRWWVVAHHDLDVVFLLDITASQRLQQAGQAMLADLSHELRTPIATLLTHLEILGLADLDDNIRRQSLELARHEAQRMSRLVNDMFELGRLEMMASMVRRPLDLLALVEEATAQVMPAVRAAEAVLDVKAERSLPYVLGHRDRLRQVLLNLLDNALKYGGTGVTITVTVEEVPEGVRCSICDTGPGIAGEHLPYLTQRFYRVASEDVEGSGLGLALVREILRHHQSSLDIRSPVAEGRGACFSFTLGTTGIQRGKSDEPPSV